MFCHFQKYKRIQIIDQQLKGTIRGEKVFLKMELHSVVKFVDSYFSSQDATRRVMQHQSHSLFIEEIQNISNNSKLHVVQFSDSLIFIYNISFLIL